MKFDLVSWCAVSTRLVTPEHWQQWAQDTLLPDTLPEQKPELSFLPALQRRRLSLAARLMFQAAYEVVGEQHCPTVFVSHDGELNRSFELWQTLLRDGDVSPTSFGLSVHNALIGQWSILRGDTSEHTALAAQQNGWEIAITEAVALLNEGVERVLVIAADEPLHHHDAIVANRAPFPYAVAALLQCGETCQLTHTTSPLSHTQPYWSALDWAKHMTLAPSQQPHSYQTGAWQWHITP